MTTEYCGNIAVIGRSNVGKSTLVNALVGRDVSIASPKSQTTRHRIQGIYTQGPYQCIFIDTPGLHRNTVRQLNRYMNRMAQSVLDDVDVILFVTQATQWHSEDQWVLDQISQHEAPCIWVINMSDTLSNDNALLPLVKSVSKKHSFNDVIAISATRGTQLDLLKQAIQQLLPQRTHRFSPDQHTDRDLPFQITELIRTQLFHHLRQELPYETYVELDDLQEEERRYMIQCSIIVESASQKGIVIGRGGQMIKQIGQDARQHIEPLFSKPVHLKLWVKVTPGWSNDPKIIGQQKL